MYRLIFWPVLAPSFLLGVAMGAMMPVLVLAALELGASAPLASAIVALMGATALVMTVPVGMFIDTVGDRFAMALATGAAVVTISLAVVALAWPTPWSLGLFIASAILRAPVMTAWNLARQAVVAETVPTPQRGQAMTALGGTMRAGSLVGPLCGAALLVFWPLWSVFVFAAACALAGTLLLFVRKLTSGFDAQTMRNKAARTADELAQGVRWRAVGFAGVSVLTLAVARVAQPILVALWGVHLGWTAAQVSLIVAVGAAIELVFMVPGGVLKDRVGRTLTLVLCLGVYGAGFLVAPLWPASPGLIAAVVVMSVGNGLGAGINMTIGADLSPARGRARFLSIWAMFSQAGQLGGPLAVSGLLLAASLPVAITVVGGVALVGALWATLTAPITQLPGRQRS
ncbi:MFS transporter [Propioniciclava soli]|uniref:MFS transporter n=1 Tax=Propioniciclava soli TaxID=2775081 RepID=A0ABZ3C754_9ACTN|nr:MFS transporter [Propioniciclava soli]